MFEELKPHIVELRKRLAISIGTIIVLFFVMFAFWEPLLDWMITPLVEVLPEGSEMVSRTVPGAFFAALKVAFFTGFVASLPVIFWQLWGFISPGLYENEKKMVVPFVSGATIMFLIGCAFCYYVVIPFGYEFLINFGSQLFTALPSIEDYISFFTKLLLGFGLAFELPVITFFLATIGLVTDKTLKDFFRYALILIFLVAALLTPPDLLTQFLMAGPMIVLYGASILIAKKVNPHVEQE
jgi:sec-independent protein translocase protein TatC